MGSKWVSKGCVITPESDCHKNHIPVSDMSSVAVSISDIWGMTKAQTLVVFTIVESAGRDEVQLRPGFELRRSQY